MNKNSAGGTEVGTSEHNCELVNPTSPREHLKAAYLSVCQLYGVKMTQVGPSGMSRDMKFKWSLVNQKNTSQAQVRTCDETLWEVKFSGLEHFRT